MILQSHSNKKQDGIDRKTDTLISETELKAQKSMPLCTTNLQQRSKEYTMDKASIFSKWWGKKQEQHKKKAKLGHWTHTVHKN